ncbi:MAG: DUF4177 domain-containing protein [Clostridiales Family XIII bacterium]|nr:DUF4177 domain-containing protein [Clostridiales Family XIII bacterium]
MPHIITRVRIQAYNKNYAMKPEAASISANVIVREYNRLVIAQVYRIETQPIGASKDFVRLQWQIYARLFYFIIYYVILILIIVAYIRCKLKRGVLMKEYKVLTQKDKWFSGKFDPAKLEEALNAYSQQGWRVLTCATADIPGFGSSRQEFITVMEREV